MKETVLDLLMYLFENHMEEEPHLPPAPLRTDLQQKLLHAGFDADEIGRAFSWLDAAANEPTERATVHGAEVSAPKPTSFRVFTAEEQMALDIESRGLLIQLEAIGVLSAQTRETVIERALALDNDELDIEDIKWVVMLVLFARPGEEAAFAWMEDLVFAETAELLH
jgi:Smg protein